MNAKILKSKMVLAGDEDFVNSLSKILGVSRQTASTKLNGESELTETEIKKLAVHYNMTDEDIRQIFIEGDTNNESERSSEVTG